VTDWQKKDDAAQKTQNLQTIFSQWNRHECHCDTQKEQILFTSVQKVRFYCCCLYCSSYYIHICMNVINICEGIYIYIYIYIHSNMKTYIQISIPNAYTLFISILRLS
jgi:hypothetical protein